MKYRLALVAGLLLMLQGMAAAQGTKVDAIEGLTDKSIPEALRSALAPMGYKVSDEGGVLCEIWFRATLPVSAPSGDDSAIAYAQLAPSTWMGVVHFARKAQDFRGQNIAPGFYTLRYALIPADGNHMGVSSNRDFLLLAPVAGDADPKASFSFEKLVAMSRIASGTNHPAPLSMLAESGETPRVFSTDEGYTALAVRVKTADITDLPIAVVVKGVAKQ